MSFNIEIEGGTSVRLPTAGKYCDRDIVVTATGGGGDTSIEDGLVSHTLSAYFNDRVAEIPYGTFYRNVNLTNISFPNVTSVGGYAFWGCKELSTIDIPKLQTVGDYAFNGNNVLDLVLPELIEAGVHSYSNMRRCETITAPKLRTVGSSCFRGVSGSKLQKVDFGALEELASMALYWNVNLATLIIRTNKMCSLASTNVFTSTKIASGTGYIYIPATLIETYKADSVWSTYATQFRALEDYTVDGTITGALDETKI